MCVSTHREDWLNCQAKRNFVLDSDKSKIIPCKPERRYYMKIPLLKFEIFRIYRMQIKKRCPIFSTFNSFLPSRSWAADIKLNLVSQTVHFVKEILALVFITVDFESFSPYWSIFKHRETSHLHAIFAENLKKSDYPQTDPLDSTETNLTCK